MDTTCLFCSHVGDQLVSSGQLCWSWPGSLPSVRLSWPWPGCALAFTAPRTCPPPPPGTSGPGQAWPSHGDGWQTCKRANPKAQAHFKPLLCQVYAAYHQLNLMTWWVLLSEVMAGHPALVRRACMMTYVTEAMATGRNGRWEFGGHFCGLMHVKTLT